MHANWTEDRTWPRSLKPQFPLTESAAAMVNPFAGFNLTTLAPKAKWGKGMSNEDRRAKLVAKLLRQKEVVAPGYCAPKTKGGKDKREAWVNALKDGTYVFYVRYGHSELELAPGLKGVAVANMSEIPAIIDRIIEVIYSGHFDVQMQRISDNLAARRKSKGNKSASVQQAA
jgi:hypothetical protein